ncbi:MAG: ribbon-helix-helix protein, CopG family [Deltaproteobacteria bacterium]|nr:ribbon-helix-helix protein, CopG family [Deltaproteobacteria bacterium]
MPVAKIAISLEKELLDRLDRLVSEGRFSNRSQAIRVAVFEKLDRLDGSRLARECAKLDVAQEQAMADEGLGAELEQWPEY